MKLATLLCACLLFTTGTWAYSRDCAKGPEYWCRDVSTAEDCGAVRHCQQTIWRENEINNKPMTNSETAQMLCNVLVQASKELLGDGSMNFNSIKQSLRQDCIQLPHQNQLIQKCQIAVDTYLPDILRHIESGTEITKICPIIQGHDTSNVFIPKPKPIGLTSNATCVLCEFVLHILQAFATANSSAQELTVLLEQVCREMPTVLRDECKSFVDSYGVDIIALLVREVDPAKICEFIKVCPKPKDVAFLTKPNLHTCGLCDYVSTYLSAGYPIENVCSHFTSNNNIKQQCEILTHLYKPNFCSQLPLCFDDVVIQPIETIFASAECSLCKYVVNYIDAVIQTNKSEAAIEAALEKVCGILPVPIKAPCVKFVDAYGPILVQLIEKYGQADKVCNALKLCINGTQEINTLQKAKVEKLSLDLPCLLCKLVIGYLETATQGNKSSAAIEAALDKVCNILPGSLKDNCTQFVKTYGPIIALLLKKNATTIEICDFLKVCKNGTQQITPNDLIPTMVNSAECSLCKYVVGYIDNVIQNNKSEAAIDAALEKVCTILPASLKDKCVQFVDSYGPVLAQLIAKYATPEQVCNALKLCHNGTQEITPLVSGLTQLLRIKQSPVNSAECSLCKYVVNYVDAVIQTNKTEAAIEAALEKVCGILPEPLKGACVKFVDVYGPILVQLIEKYGQADKVCDALKLCINGTESIQPVAMSLDRSFEADAQPIKLSSELTSAIGSAECSLCKYVVNYVDAVIQNNKTEAAIEAALEKVCGILPEPLKGACVKFVDVYGPILVQLIEKYGQADKVCDALKLCINGTESIQPVAKSLDLSFGTDARPIKLSSELTSAIGSAECSLCKYVVNYVDTVIQNNKTEAAIEAALEKVCGILPEPLKGACVKFVDVYGPILVQLIEKYGQADKVCDALKLCINGTQVADSISHDIVKSIKSIKDSAECTLCKYVLSYIDLLINANATEQEFEKALEVVCSILPSTYHTKCEEFVKTYGPILAELIAELDDPNVVCEWLGLCKNSDNKFIEIPALKTKNLKSLPCNLCQYLVNYLDAIIQSNSTETKFEDALDKACKILPETKLQSECKQLVHLYGSDLIKYLVEYGDPKAVCQAIGICDK